MKWSADILNGELSSCISLSGSSWGLEWVGGGKASTSSSSSIMSEGGKRASCCHTSSRICSGSHIATLFHMGLFQTSWQTMFPFYANVLQYQKRKENTALKFPCLNSELGVGMLLYIIINRINNSMINLNFCIGEKQNGMQEQVEGTYF